MTETAKDFPRIARDVGKRFPLPRGDGGGGILGDIQRCRVRGKPRNKGAGRAERPACRSSRRRLLVRAQADLTLRVCRVDPSCPPFSLIPKFKSGRRNELTARRLTRQLAERLAHRDLDRRSPHHRRSPQPTHCFRGCPGELRTGPVLIPVRIPVHGRPYLRFGQSRNAVSAVQGSSAPGGRASRAFHAQRSRHNDKLSAMIDLRFGQQRNRADRPDAACSVATAWRSSVVVSSIIESISAASIRIPRCNDFDCDLVTSG